MASPATEAQFPHAPTLFLSLLLFSLAAFASALWFSTHLHSFLTPTHSPLDRVFTPSHPSPAFPLQLQSPRQPRSFPSSPAASSSSSAPAASSPPTTVAHLLFSIGSSSDMWMRRRELVRSWWGENRTRGFVWLEKVPPAEDCSAEPGHPFPNGGCTAGLPTALVSSNTEHLKQGGGIRDFIRHARMVTDAFRLGVPGVRWFVMSDDDTFMNPLALAALLSTIPYERPAYLGSISETHFMNSINSFSMAFGGGGYAISLGLARVLNRTLDACLDRHVEMWGSDMRVAACVAETGVPLTLAPGMHQCDLQGNLAGLLQSHPLHPFISLHHLEYLHPVLQLAGVPDRHQGLQLLSKYIEPDPLGFLQQAVCHDREEGAWTASIAWGFSVRVYPGVRGVWEVAKVERAFSTFVGTADPWEYSFDTRNFEPDAPPHKPCDLPFTLHISQVFANEDGGVTSVYKRLSTRLSLNYAACNGSVVRVNRAVVVRPRPMHLCGGQLFRERCGRVEYRVEGGETVLWMLLEDAGFSCGLQTA